MVVEEVGVLVEAGAARGACAALVAGRGGTFWFITEIPHHKANIPTKRIARALRLRRPVLICSVYARLFISVPIYQHYHHRDSAHRRTAPAIGRAARTAVPEESLGPGTS